jgi:tRNA nucleotidyltransferase (CCA-adding enzyme)
MPCLSYLPTLTPEEESVRLLSAVYPALLTLIQRRYATPSEDGERQRIKALDKILRVGILHGYAHAGENVTIATLLVSQISDLVNQMGIVSVKHLKVCISMPN